MECQRPPVVSILLLDEHRCKRPLHLHLFTQLPCCTELASASSSLRTDPDCVLGFPSTRVQCRLGEKQCKTRCSSNISFLPKRGCSYALAFSTLFG